MSKMVTIKEQNMKKGFRIG